MPSKIPNSNLMKNLYICLHLTVLTYILHGGVSVVVEEPDHLWPGVAAPHHTLERHPPALNHLLLQGGDLHELGKNFKRRRFNSDKIRPNLTSDINHDGGGLRLGDVVVVRQTGELGPVVLQGHAGQPQHVHRPLSSPGDQSSVERVGK